MTKKFIKRVLGIILALSMTAQVVICSYAGNTQPAEYIEDILVSYDKQKLIDAGYRVIDNNVNEDSYGQSVYIGFKTTTDRDNAITDIAVMNMNGRYSFDKYAEYLSKVKSLATEMANQFIFTVAEFAKVYNKDPEALLAGTAYKLLNKFYDDDLISDAYPNGTPLGVIFTDPALTTINFEDNVQDEAELTIKNELTKILYQSNSENLASIKSFLSLGITETGTDTFLTRLKSFEYTKQLETSLSETRQDILDGYKDVREYLKAAEEYGKAAKAVKKAGGKVEDYIATFKEDDRPVIAAYIAVYNAAVSCQYSSNLIYNKKKLTLFDVFTLPTQDEYLQLSEEGDEPDCKYYMDAYMAEILAKSLTKGQVGSLSAVSLTTLIINTKYADTDLSDTLTAVFDELNAVSEISVYAGVDRTLFSHPEDIALTSAAIDEMNKTGQNNIGRLGETYWSTHESFRTGMICTTAIAGTIGLGLLIAGAAMKIVRANVPQHALYLASVNKLSGMKYSTVLGSSFQTASTVLCVVGAVALVISFVFMLITLAKAYEKPKQPDDYEKIKYTKIPRILVNMKEVNGEKQYYNYYCCKLAGAADDETDFMCKYGDLNGKDNHSQWACLYYTKDKRCGTPLTANAIVSYGSPNDELSTDKYLAVHPFDSEGATNLNAYNVKAGAKLICLYVEKSQETLKEEPTADPTEASGTEEETEEAAGPSSANASGLWGTISSGSGPAFYIIFFILGAVVSYAVTYLTMKKKKTEE